MKNKKNLEKITGQGLNDFLTSILNANNSNIETAYYNLGILLFSKYSTYKKNKEKSNNKTLVLRRK